MSDDNDSPVGYAALEAALDKTHPDPNALVMHSPIPRMLGGEQALDDIYVRHVDQPEPHWLLVSAGLTELYDKESPNREVSGFGLELTLRVKRAEGEQGPPNWAINFLENVGHYIASTGNVFGDGHTMDLNGPICAGDPTEIQAMTARLDPALGSIDTPNGHVDFIQIVGITGDELAAMKAWKNEAVLVELNAVNALGIIDLRRLSVLSNPEAAKRIAEGTAREGSSTGFLFDGYTRFKVSSRLFGGRRADVYLGAGGVAEVARIVQGRLPFGRELILQLEDGSQLVFEPGKPGWRAENTDGATPGQPLQRLVLTLDADSTKALVAALQPRRGDFALPGTADVTFHIEQTVIRDPQGRPVETIG
ncbi:MAG: suppressor of fused domain protein [Phycisphaerae bacterium]|nr:suppressor of fused domain protein [Phycisphaerae bacterium]